MSKQYKTRALYQGGRKMKQVYMHFEQKKDKIEYTLLAILILMYGYGVYKNGLSYVFIGKMNLLSALEYFLCPLISILSQMIFSRKMKLTIKDGMESLLLSIMIPPRFPIWCFTILVALYYFGKKIGTKKMLCISNLLLFKILTSFIATIILKIDYQNIVEVNNAYLYSPADLLFGRGVGNLGSTSILLMIIYFGVSLQDVYYKKELPTTMIATYVILAIIYASIGTQKDILSQILNSHLFFAAVFLSTKLGTSPAEKKYLMIHGIATSILGFVLTTIFDLQDGIYYSLFVMQILWMFLHQRMKKI